MTTGSAVAVLYQPAFAALTRWYGERRVQALTAVTLVGGLASTVFAPLTAGIAQHLDWRGTYLVLAGLFGLVTIPAHALGLRLPSPPHEHDPRVDHAPGAVARSRPFAVLVVALGLGSFAVYAVVVALVPLLTERGLSTTTAAWALGLGGVGQVLGRLGYARFVAVTGVRARTAIVVKPPCHCVATEYATEHPVAAAASCAATAPPPATAAVTAAAAANRDRCR